MPRGPNMNMEDPAVQERIRRGPHDWVMRNGKMTYVEKTYIHQEYPKWLTPEGPIAHSKAEEDRWLAGQKQKAAVQAEETQEKFGTPETTPKKRGRRPKVTPVN